ncbi:MAG: Maf family protein [Actinomycetota bacterium]|jgi:septum formation protein|nr:Maf family protein [Actinomycetota bacterium]
MTDSMPSSVFALHELAEVVLASASPRRRDLFALAGIPFTVIPAEHEEPWDHALSPDEAIIRVARAKATWVRRQLPEDDHRCIVACDTAVLLDDHVFGKPKDRDDAAQMIHMLSGCTHQVKSGVCILAPSASHTFVETTEVTFHPLTDRDIEAYLDCDEYRDKAGAYGIQGRGSLLVSRITGDYLNVVGLPLARLARVLIEVCR